MAMAGTKRRRANDPPNRPAKRRRTTTAAEEKEQRTEAARAAVLGTTELLENILMQLPVKKIFTIQRVSKAFRDTIENSSVLQDKLWIKWIGPEKEPIRCKIEGSRGDCHLARAGPDEKTSVRDKRRIFDVSEANSGLFEDEESLFARKPHKKMRHAVEVRIFGYERRDLKRCILASLAQSWDGQSTSLQRLHLTKPTCKHVRVGVGIRIGENVQLSMHSVPISDASGVTLGMLETAFRQSYADGGDKISRLAKGNGSWVWTPRHYGEKSLEEVLREESQETPGEVRLSSISLEFPERFIPFAEEWNQLG